ncbi:MAG TPA: radical SAM protein [Vicinamibacteria bacterium]|nr:radical SAM protein [Vicinamibacteria bacterium]
MKLKTRVVRTLRIARKFARALAHRHHPILVHVIPMRRCNLACSYCNEYDAVSKPVPSDVMLGRIDKVAELGTAVMTFSGGEPMMHPDLDRLVAHGRRRGMIVTLISNGYYLSPERIERLNAAGLDHLQISVDNVEPDESSMKSLRLLDPKLRWLAEKADFTVAINSVVGSGIRKPEDALVVARRARELGFMSSLGIIHDGHGQLRPLSPREMRVYEELKGVGRRGIIRFNRLFQDNLARGLSNDWSCRAGARYLYVDENGLVSYCSQQRGLPGLPLERYSLADVRREYDTRKSCAAYCTVNCVQQTAILDNWRAPQRALALLPKRPSLTAPMPAPQPAAEDEVLVG